MDMYYLAVQYYLIDASPCKFYIVHDDWNSQRLPIEGLEISQVCRSQGALEMVR